MSGNRFILFPSRTQVSSSQQVALSVFLIALVYSHESGDKPSPNGHLVVVCDHKCTFVLEIFYSLFVVLVYCNEVFLVCQVC